MTAFRHLGGSVLWQTTVLSDEDAFFLWNVFLDESLAAYTAGDVALEQVCAGRAANIAITISEAQRWRKAAQGARS